MKPDHVGEWELKTDIKSPLDLRNFHRVNSNDKRAISTKNRVRGSGNPSFYLMTPI